MLQGILLNDVRINKGIQLRAHYRNGGASAEKITSSPVIRIEPGYILTADTVYQVLRIPPPKPAAPAAKQETQPSRTIIPESKWPNSPAVVAIKLLSARWSPMSRCDTGSRNEVPFGKTNYVNFGEEATLAFVKSAAFWAPSL